MATENNWNEWFGWKKWRIAEEITGVTGMQRNIKVTFTRGRFVIDPPGAFESPLSTNKGRTGYVLQQTDQTGTHDVPGGRVCFGDEAVKKAQQQGAIW